MKILAHRGASADAPENTLEAFQLAVEQGADGVELDVMACGSGEVVVCHDEELSRLAGVRWEVGRTPWWKLRQADVGSQLGHGPARIPLLEEVLRLLPPQLVINVELKCDTVEDRGLCAGVAALLAQVGAEARVVISSFNPFCLWRSAQLAPTLRRGFLIDPDRPVSLQDAVLVPLVSSYSVHPHHQDIQAGRVQRWRSLGLEVAAWTVDDVAEALRLRSLGVRYCITNTPGRLRQALGREVL